MKNPRHQFILLGFLAQSLVWDNWIAPIICIVGWIICLSGLRGRLKISLTLEALILFAGCVGAYFLGKAFNKTTHFFLGEGLILLQATRLIRPLNPKEKLTSLLIACFHFGVVCTLAPNIRFAILFLAAAGLFPKALQEIQIPDRTAEPVPIRLGLGRYAAVVGISLAAFVLLPRFFTGAPIFARGESTLLDSVLDPSRSGSANSDRVLLQIQGERIGYLRCYSLTEFDGVTWNAEQNLPLRRVRFAAEAEFPKLLERTVRVKTTSGLGRVLPTDGNVRFVTGNFFAKPLEDPNTIIETTGMWNGANNVYRYWIETNAFQERLSREVRRKLTYFPQQPPRLQDWLKRAEAAGTNSLTRARAVEGYLRNHYSYRLGTPELSRLNPVDDFIFNRTEGHCERFAAALALFLRMQGTPSRVVIGYVAASQNPFTGWQQVRFKDAHAWVEGYFEDVGWVQFDATPGPPPDDGLNFIHFMEALDFAWYSYVVNFDGMAQRQVLQNWAEGIARRSPQIRELGVVFFSGLFVAGILVWAWGFRKKLPKKKQPQRMEELNHQYGRMLKLLGKAGYEREPWQTPLEFLASLQQEELPGLELIEQITRTFCEATYGMVEPSRESIKALDDQLLALECSLRHHRRSLAEKV